MQSVTLGERSSRFLVFAIFVISLFATGVGSLEAQQRSRSLGVHSFALYPWVNGVCQANIDHYIIDYTLRPTPDDPGHTRYYSTVFNLAGEWLASFRRNTTGYGNFQTRLLCPINQGETAWHATITESHYQAGTGLYAGNPGHLRCSYVSAPQLSFFLYEDAEFTSCRRGGITFPSFACVLAEWILC